MTVKLDKKIIGYKVVTSSNDEALPEEKSAASDLDRSIEQMHENLGRPEELHGFVA